MPCNCGKRQTPFRNYAPQRIQRNINHRNENLRNRTYKIKSGKEKPDDDVNFNIVIVSDDFFGVEYLIAGYHARSVSTGWFVSNAAPSSGSGGSDGFFAFLSKSAICVTHAS